MSSTVDPQAPTPRPSKSARSRARTILGWTIVGSFLLLVGLFLVGYATTPVPSPNSFATSQTSVFTYDDGRTELGRVGTLNRIDVPLRQVPLGVRRAVLAAEDRDYYSQPGVSPRGILRAVWANARGGGISQGGSTITQQYAKNAFLTKERTISRKVREIFIAMKLDRTRSKDDVLRDYLNTIYFGRGAYGISTAAQAYFGKPVASLNVAQGALLAAAVQAPSRYDPLKHPAAARQRWQYVIDGMVSQKWLAAADAAALKFPAVRKPTSRNALGGPNGHLVEAVRAELDTSGFDEDRLSANGYRVQTTIDRKLQAAAIGAVQDVLTTTGPVGALAAVEPTTGRIMAMYGGRDYTGSQPAAQINLATNRRPPGSSFKPYTLATALTEGISLRTDYRGSSPLAVDGWGSKGNLVRNDSGEQCPRCDLIESTALSVNTVYAQLVFEVGPEKVARLAKAAGVTAPLSDRNGVVPPSITLGTKSVSALDQAAGFATFAAGGEHVTPHLVAKVLDSAGRTVYTAKPSRKRAFSAGVAADATHAMTGVVRYGTGTRARLDDGRPVAGKTGTTNDNTDAWFVGFTPQLSTAVWLGNVDNAPLTNVEGYSGGIYGGQLPAEIWNAFMTEAMADVPVKEFPEPVFDGSTSSGLAPPPPPPPPPSASPSGSPSPMSPSPSASVPSASPSATPTPSASPSPAAPVATRPLPTPTRSAAPTLPQPTLPQPTLPKANPPQPTLPRP